MPSTTDFDQGGTVRTFMRQYLGPSIGWVEIPYQNILPITAAGTYTLQPNTTLVTVNAAGAVIIVLPSTTQPTPAAGAGAQPQLYSNQPVTIVDVGGLAQANPITINPAAGDTVMGLGAGAVKITANYGGYTLTPNRTQRTWSATP